MFAIRRNRVGQTLFSLVLAGVVFLLLTFLTTSSLTAAPNAKIVKRLNLNDKLVVKSLGCTLNVSSTTTTRIVMQCTVTGVPLEKIYVPQVKTVLTLQAGDKLIVKANVCQLQTLSSTTTRVVIKCIADTLLDWLTYVNKYRALAALPPVSENTAWSNGNWLHARYMVKNDFIGHTEDPNKPWYTEEGLAAAQSSNLIVSGSATMTDAQAIDGWMQAPFHAVGIIDPALGQVGYGSYREADGGVQTGAGLDVIRGLGDVPSTVSYPVMWPANGKIATLLAYYGGEYPNPLASCPGYTTPSGLPIILQLGHWSITPNVTAHSFKEGATSLAHCIFDETSYTNPDSAQQSLARSVLNARDAIVLIPRVPLGPGKTYTVSITTNGNSYTWSFNVSSAVAERRVPEVEMR